jgi:Holliday junction DNA helicase RuvA
MIVGIDGLVIKKEPIYLHIDLNGLIYNIYVSINCSSNVKIDEKVKLNITHIIKETSQELFGFLDINEKKMFDTLIKINGVGPKVAMAICSTFSPQEFSKLIELNDKNGLKKVPGIGPKSATRILLELNDFKIDDNNYHNKSSYLDAISALESLGFKKEQIEKVLSNSDLTNVEELVKFGLQKLGRI